MKKFLMVVVLTLTLLLPLTSVNAGGFESCLSTGAADEDGVVRTGRGYLCGVVLTTNGQANATIALYDNTSDDGKVVLSFTVVGADYYGGVTFPNPVRFIKGLFLDISGTGATAYVFWTR
jgi:hypothetical protein